MLRGIVQSLSLEVFKTELERAVGNPVWSQSSPGCGQEETPSNLNYPMHYEPVLTV